MNRRTWLALIGAGSIPVGASQAREAADIKITGLEVFRVHVNRRGNWVLFRLQTDAGITGIGDASHGGRDDLNNCLSSTNTVCCATAHWRLNATKAFANRKRWDGPPSLEIGLMRITMGR